MKRIIILLSVIILACGFASAKKIFVEMRFHNNCIDIDDGTSKKWQTIKNEEGKNLKFISLTGALNYMSLQGWELVDIKTVTKGEGVIDAYGGRAYTGTNVYYLFSREVSDDELSEAVNKSYKQ
jgi:hypothetical protein